MSYLNQKTIKNAITFSGIGLHSGVDVNVTIKPAIPLELWHSKVVVIPMLEKIVITILYTWSTRYIQWALGCL